MRIVYGRLRAARLVMEKIQSEQLYKKWWYILIAALVFILFIGLPVTVVTMAIFSK
ncbi:MAG: hypothetical protein KKH93_02790 [Candidatus Omnitrophica bacterium]|nr:hypothetical protein [Candidatus Omnitrophota bacterium]MBU2044521.1 hypothetical protein [Candidatus Omnitrophota bacterium]MBU2251632.1 hypothetical protein [Candidatus Omnitrophota bacterium]